MLITERPAKSTLERVLIETTVQFELLSGASLSGLSSDLSVGGMYLKTEEILENDETMTLSFSVQFMDCENRITCQAKVAWTNYENLRLKLDYPPGVGVEFQGLSSKDCSLLSNFINSYDEHKKMNMICAWCGKHLGLRMGPYGKTSHGICGQCKEKHFQVALPLNPPA